MWLEVYPASPICGELFMGERALCVPPQLDDLKHDENGDWRSYVIKTQDETKAPWPTSIDWGFGMAKPLDGDFEWGKLHSGVQPRMNPSRPWLIVVVHLRACLATLIGLKQILMKKIYFKWVLFEIDVLETVHLVTQYN